MTILFGHALKGFVEWFTTNQAEIELAYKELNAEELLGWSLEDFAIELCLEMRGIETVEPDLTTAESLI